MRHLEDQICTSLYQWFSLQHRSYAGLLIHIPNGGKRNAREAARFKGMGVTAGVSDYFIPVPKGPYCGLWLEIKTPKGKLQPNQRDFLNTMEGLGYRSEVAYGLEQAINIINEYLGVNSGRQAS